jgi:hypothetical protein
MKNLAFLSSRLLFSFLITICIFLSACAGGGSSSHHNSDLPLKAVINPQTAESLGGPIGTNNPCLVNPHVNKTVTCGTGTSRLAACIKKTSNNNNVPNVTIQLKAFRNNQWHPSDVITDTTNNNEDCNSHAVSLQKQAGDYKVIIKGASCGRSHFDALVECQGNPASTQITQ